MVKTAVFRDRVKVWLGKDVSLLSEITVNEYGSFVAVSSNPDTDARTVTESVLLMVLHTFTNNAELKKACLKAARDLGVELGEPETIVATTTDDEQRFPF